MARLASGLLVSALLRRAFSDGGSGAVLRRGDDESGAILILSADRGRTTAVLERQRDPMTARLGWVPVGPARDDSGEATAAYLSRRIDSDPDLWIVELDVAGVERLAAEMTGDD